MERREFLKKGTGAIAALMLQSKIYALVNDDTRARQNILCINATGIDEIHNSEDGSIDISGINLFKQNSVCSMQTYMNFLNDTANISAMFEEVKYQKFHVGYRNLSGKDEKESITVLHEGGCCGEFCDQDVTDGARAFLRNYNEPYPFFLSVNYNSFGEAFSATKQDKNLRLIEKIDMEIELLVHELKRSQWKDNTQIIISEFTEYV